VPNTSICIRLSVHDNFVPGLLRNSYCLRICSQEEAEPEPDFGLSGKLAAESNKVNGVVLVYNEPAEASATQTRWRLYQFKKGEPFQVPIAPPASPPSAVLPPRYRSSCAPTPLGTYA